MNTANETSELRQCVVNQTLPTRVTIPSKVETLPEWGSKILWGQMYKAKRLGPSAGHRSDWWVPVVCSNPFNAVNCGGTRNVQVRRMSPGVLSADSLAYSTDMAFTGLCQHCSMIVNNRGSRLASKLPDGSEVIIPQDSFAAWRAAGLLEFNCGGCGKRQSLKYSPSIPDDYAFNCPACDHAVGVEVHQSGAKILWLVYYLKHLFDPPQDIKLGKYLVPYVCSLEDCDTVTLARPDVIRSTQFSSRGLCELHQGTTPRLGTIAGDFCLLSFRSVVFNSRREENSVPVQCGLLDCGEENLYHALSTRRETFTGYCTSHTDKEIVEGTLRRAQAQNGNGQMPLQLDAEGLKILEIVNAVIIVWKEVNNPNLLHDENLALVKQAKVAKKLGLGDEKSPEGANALAGRLRRSRMKEVFPDNASRFRDFVKATVNDFKLGTAPEAIVFGLLHRLDAAASAA